MALDSRGNNADQFVKLLAVKRSSVIDIEVIEYLSH